MNNGNDRTAIITGGSRGLGRNTAVNLACRGGTSRLRTMLNDKPFTMSLVATT
jgi:NAD(P)-dependent dehydrogenase (short-subunit alcohol dehydrogenase family)